MSVTEQQSDLRALNREWLVARVVIIGGLVVAALVVAWFGWLKPTYFTKPQLTPAQLAAQATARAVFQMCSTGVAAAKSFGILPQYGQLSKPVRVGRTDVMGRYVCLANTQVARYVIAVELLCPQTSSRQCVSLYSVIQDDGTPQGTVLYQRQS